MTTNMPRMTRMNSSQMYVLKQLILLIDRHLLGVVPADVIYRVVWEVALLSKNITILNHQHKLHNCIVATLKDEIYHNLLYPYLYGWNVKIPSWMSPRDVLDILSHANLYNIKVLTTIYNSLASLAYDSPYFQEVLAYLKDCPESDEGREQ